MGFVEVVAFGACSGPSGGGGGGGGDAWLGLVELVKGFGGNG